MTAGPEDLSVEVAARALSLGQALWTTTTGTGDMGNDESREEVPMTAALLDEPGVVHLRRGPDTPMLVAYVLEGRGCREVAVARAGEPGLDRLFPAEVRPAELVGPRRRS